MSEVDNIETKEPGWRQQFGFLADFEKAAENGPSVWITKVTLQGSGEGECWLSTAENSGCRTAGEILGFQVPYLSMSWFDSKEYFLP